jgi:hypothetical protein
VGKQMTEMLKGTLEGIVRAILSVRPAYGYEITARLREQGFSDIAEGTFGRLVHRIPALPGHEERHLRSHRSRSAPTSGRLIAGP